MPAAVKSVTLADFASPMDDASGSAGLEPAVVGGAGAAVVVVVVKPPTVVEVVVL